MISNRFSNLFILALAGFAMADLLEQNSAEGLEPRDYHHGKHSYHRHDQQEHHGYGHKNYHSYHPHHDKQHHHHNRGFFDPSHPSQRAGPNLVPLPHYKPYPHQAGHSKRGDYHDKDNGYHDNSYGKDYHKDYKHEPHHYEVYESQKDHHDGHRHHGKHGHSDHYYKHHAEKAHKDHGLKEYAHEDAPQYDHGYDHHN